MVETIRVVDQATNETVDAVPVKVTKVEEPFLYAELEDGTNVTVRTTLSRVIRLLDRWDARGEPRYDISFNVNMTVDAAPHLKKDGVPDA